MVCGLDRCESLQTIVEMAQPPVRLDVGGARGLCVTNMNQRNAIRRTCTTCVSNESRGGSRDGMSKLFKVLTLVLSSTDIKQEGVFRIKKEIKEKD